MGFNNKRKNDNKEEKSMKRIKKINEEDFEVAALNGDLEKMKYLKMIGVEFGLETLYHAMTHAVKNKTSKNLEWVRENNIMDKIKYKSEFDERCELIAYGESDEDFEGLKYLKEAGYNLHDNMSILRHAVESGKLERVKWCIEVGLPFEDAMYFSLYDVRMREFLVKNGCPFSDGIETTFKSLFADCIDIEIESVLDAMEFLKRKGCPFGPDVNTYGAPPMVLAWLKSNGCKWSGL